MTKANLQGGNRILLFHSEGTRIAKKSSKCRASIYVWCQKWLLTATFEDLSISSKGTRKVKRENNECNHRNLLEKQMKNVGYINSSTNRRFCEPSSVFQGDDAKIKICKHEQTAL